MTTHTIATRDKWLEARLDLLAAEKDLTRRSDEVAQLRRQLPWVRVEKNYVFEGPNGRETLADLFAGHSQLVVQQFMLAPGWEEGCKSCSFMADHTDAMTIHLEHRDVTMVAISRAPLAEIERFRRRMGWQFKWVSSYGTDFNYDFGVSFTPEQAAEGKVNYNYGSFPRGVDELPGVSVFYKDEADDVFHTYSTYGRGVEVMMGTYRMLDLTPKGRDEQEGRNMAWVRHHDRYEPQQVAKAAPATGSCCSGRA
jgi:predicted dithiol-disulfide oxidoreductase (DUF899 family)